MVMSENVGLIPAFLQTAKHKDLIVNCSGIMPTRDK